MLADVSGEEVEAYLVTNSLVGASEKEVDVPTDQACGTEAERLARPRGWESGLY